MVTIKYEMKRVPGNLAYYILQGNTFYCQRFLNEPVLFWMVKLIYLEVNQTKEKDWI